MAYYCVLLKSTAAQRHKLIKTFIDSLSRKIEEIEEINIETNLSTLNIFVLKHSYRFSLDIFIHLKSLKQLCNNLCYFNFTQCGKTKPNVKTV